MDIVGCSLFGSRYLRPALNVQFHAPLQVNSTLVTCLVSSRSSPFAVSHHQHHHHHSTCNSDFSTSICPVPNGATKVTGSSIHRYRKSDFGVCANTDRVFFFPRTMRVSDNIPPNGSLNRLMINHGNRGVPSFRIQISPFS